MRMRGMKKQREATQRTRARRIGVHAETRQGLACVVDLCV